MQAIVSKILVGFQKLEKLIEGMNTRYQQQITQMQSQLDLILKSSGLTSHQGQQMFNPPVYYQQQNYRPQHMVASRELPQTFQGMTGPPLNHMVAPPVRELNHVSTHPLCS